MGTWIVGAVVALIVGLAAYKSFRDHKRGKSCGCCTACQDRSVKKTCA